MPSLTTCPACHYTRHPTDAVSALECPKCQNAHVKTAHLEHPLESVEKAQPSTKSILLSIFGRRIN